MAGGGVAVPLDLAEPPTSVLRRLRGEPGLVALTGAWCGSRALLGWRPAEVLPADADPFDLPAMPVGSGTAVVGGGWVALWGFPLSRRLERLPEQPPRPHPQTGHWAARYDWFLRYDAGRWWFESLLAADAAAGVLDGVRRRLAEGDPAPRPHTFTPFAMSPGPDHYRDAVAATVEHIRAGDVFQVNVCTRFDALLDGDPVDVFCAGVDALSPDRAAYVDTGARQVVSLSPEVFLRRVGREVESRPIKGTAPSGGDAAALTASAKDRAENVMIVDLMRNDLGRVSVTGTVRVPALAVPEQGAGVTHLVSEVHGTLPDDAADRALLTATFPPGSVTGAPKIRATELIAELEATGRELYTGSIGVVSPVAGLDSSVVIRTFELQGGACWVGVGCGVVADSDPDAELAEVFTKLDPLLAAVGATRSTTAAPRAPARRPPTFDVPAAEAPSLDRGRGVFDTLLVRDGRPVDLEAHLDRLVRDAEHLTGEPVDRAALADRIEAGVSGVTTARVRTVYDGEWTVTVDPITEGGLQPRTLAPRRVTTGLGAHKWADRRLVADPGTADDVLLVDVDDRVLEVGTANVFVVLDDTVVTPPLDGRILAGTVRARVLDLLRRDGVPVAERPISLAELPGAVEVLQTSSVRGVQPVIEVDGVGGWPPGPLTRWVREHLDRPSPPAYDVPRPPDTPRALIVDNYDSFTYNLAQRLRVLGAEVEVVRNDAATVAEVAAGGFSHVIVSPGPGRPEDAGISVEVVRALGRTTPVLGVCLGHQCIGAAYGAPVVRTPHPVHGKRSIVHHDGRGVYAALSAPFAGARYHSLVVTDLPTDLVATAHTGDGVLMGLRHAAFPVEGVQVHPESVLTDVGDRILAAFLATAGR
jgi:para-aminobenzoate synthetase/4-amino-4-deoxychorismate lyase